MTLASGSRLGPYEILSVLGAGGMGDVYRARDPRLGREVAIKVLPGAFSHDPDRLRRFEQEARAAAALNHPNILTVHEIGTHEGQPYVVSELLDGQTLRDTIPRDGMPVKRAVDAAIQICRGLAAAHEKGIVHRDLKPENVFVTTDGRIKILDFGLAKLTEAAAMAAAGATMEVTRVANTSAGLVLGTLLAFSTEWFDDSLRTLNETEGALKLPVLTTIPRLLAARRTGQQVVMEDDRPLSGAESFRAPCCRYRAPRRNRARPSRGPPA